jgi:hypothetical protein
MTVSFDPVVDGTGITVVDSIERRECVLHTPAAVDPTPVSDADDRFRRPVDRAVRVGVAGLSLASVPDVYVRDGDGQMVTEPKPGTDTKLPADVYSIELSAPIKLYLLVEAAPRIAIDADRVRLAFERERSVLVGARSYHTRPAATIETTGSPADVMAAVSQFGSALKTTSPERSYPTLRGHPPAVTFGDELSVPDRLSPPDTGVRLELPATRRAAYAAASLAYYLGADVVPGEEPRLVTDQGFEHALADGDDLERSLEQVLKQVVFLDCLVRTEGYYDVDLHERAAVEPLADLDASLATLYDQPLARQVASYLSVPFGTVEPHLPRWSHAAHVAPDPKRVEALPFLAAELALIRSACGQWLSPAAVRSTVLADYLDAEVSIDASADGDESDLIRPERMDAVEQTWFAEGVPLGASKGLPAAFRNRLDRRPEPGETDIAVVANDGVGGGERDGVSEMYASREELPFDVTIRSDLTTAELADVLTAGVEFLHYIGHVDDEGFRCRDGRLDVGSLDEVRVDAFLLNACRSYEQGRRLVAAGSVGGAVSCCDVSDGGAVAVGRTVARLLSLGFPLRAALTVTRGRTLLAGQYLVVGDGTVDIAPDENGIPILCSVVAADEDAYEVTVRTYLPSEGGMGSLAYPLVPGNRQHYLASGELDTFRVSAAELREFATLYRCPIEFDGELYWGGTADPLNV